MANGRKALGRGLGALIAPPRFSNARDDYFMCALDAIRPDPDQPRQRFDDQRLAELVASIREKGILQPLVVRRADGPDSFILIAGERRLRAAKLAGLDDVPVVVKDVASDEAFELALIENIQREDLNPIEEAAAYDRLLNKPGYTQHIVARKVGKDRTTITNATRLLKLTSDHQQLVIDGTLTAGHARCLLSVGDDPARAQLAERIVAEGLSVRQAEVAARALKGEPSPARRSPRKPKKAAPLQPYFDTVAAELAAALGVPVAVATRGKKKGRVVIEFGSVEQLRALRDRLLASEADEATDTADGAPVALVG